MKLILDAFIERTHCEQYPIYFKRLIEYCNLVINNPDELPYNIEYIKSLKLKWEEYIINNSIDMEIKTTNKEYKHNKYRKFCLEKQLSLSEHALFCFCKKSKDDNLGIITSHPHTQTKFSEKYEVLVDKLKAEFNVARLDYYHSVAKDINISLYNKVVISKTDLSNVKNDTKTTLLIRSFKQAYSILDKIAIGLLNLFELTYDRIYFHELNDYLSRNEDFKDNFYSLAIASIANEISHQNEKASFKEYKNWRDGIEHNYFFLIDKEMQKSHDLKGVSFVKRDLFEEKTLHLLELCRSAIFSFVFLARDISCKKQKEK